MAESPNDAERAGKADAYVGPVLLRERYLIDPSSPLGELDSPSARAYAVQDRQNLNRKVFALVCEPGLPLRTKVMAALRGATFPGMMPLVEWDTVYWPPLGQRCMAVIYARPQGGKLFMSATPEYGQINEHDLSRLVFDPLARAVNELARHGMTHGSIRPDNLFFMDEERTDVVLGECVSAPPGFNQPAALETIERALTSPGGRGEGTVGDDLFALGATLVCLLLGRNPVEDLSEDDLIAARTKWGSLTAYCGKTHIPLALVEPLRAILNDDPGQRWNREKLDLWVDGGSVTPTRVKLVPSSKTGFPFAGKEHHTARTLARAMTQNVGEAATAIKEGGLGLWLRRALKEVKRADKIVEIVHVAKARQGDWQGSDDVVVARVAMLLDPQAPIRYKGFSFLPEGYGPALAVEFTRGGDVQTAAEVVARELPGFWLSAQQDTRLNKRDIVKTFAQLRGFLQIKEPGYGIERCLYELNPSLPCQSPLVTGDHVVAIEELLPSLDHKATRGETKARPMDRHIAAFIATRFDEDTEPHLRALAAAEKGMSLIGMLSLLAFLQWRLRLGALYGLSSWVGGLLGPAINIYHSRTVRDEVERAIPRLVRQGSLPEIFDLIDDAEALTRDAKGHATARAEFIAVEAEIKRLADKGAARAAAERTGQRAAAAMSVVISLAAVAVVLVSGIW